MLTSSAPPPFPVVSTGSHANQHARLLLLTGLIFVVVILLTLIGLPPAINMHGDMLRDRAETAQRFADALTTADDRLQELRAATRGYVITRAPVFLDQYRAAQDSLPAAFDTLTQLAPAIDPDLEAPVAELRTAALRWQQEGGDRQIALAQQGRVSDAAAELASGASQDIFDTFRSRLAAVRDRTTAVRADLQDQLDRIRTLQIAATSGLGLLGLLAVGFVVVGFRQTLALIDALEMERHQTAALTAEVRMLYEVAQTERQRLEAVFAHSPEGIVVAEGSSGRLVLANPAAHALLGEPWAATAEALLAGRVFLSGGQPCLPEDIPLTATLRDGADHRRELVVAQADGTRVPVYLTSVPLRADDGTLRGAVAVIQDLRQLREVERLKSDFVALVSHELRTPLTAIKGASQTVLQRAIPADPETVHMLMQIVNEQSDRLQELIDNLLSLSQVEAGALRLRRAIVALPPLIQDVLRQQRERDAGVRIQAYIPADLPSVSADARRIEQVLTNLIENARKFSPPGGIITVGAVVDGRVVRISVRDHGPGIPVAERERVFERFHQSAQPSARGAGGTGLGLAICKALVEAHGGRIWADAAPGGGALLQFTLPLAIVDDVPAVPRARTAALAVGSPQVLVVDDDPALRQVVARSLGDAGFQVSTVAEGQAAIEALVQQPPDLVLLDVMLPGADGFALVEQVRAWTTVPIVMLTARAAEQDLVRGLRLGADDYVTKPFRLSELVARIEAVLRRTRTASAAGEPAVIEHGELTIDLAQRRVLLRNQPVALTPTEYGILIHLARHIGQLLTHEQILRAVWGEGYGEENHYLWVHIAHIRQKIEDDPRQPRYILTERGVGYRMARI